jgi:alpha-L-fucosidase
MPEAQYMQYFADFEAQDFDPRAWVKAAKEAGMQYVIFTAKYHDEFCLYFTSSIVTIPITPSG